MRRETLPVEGWVKLARMATGYAIGPERVGEAEQILKPRFVCYQGEAALYGDHSIPPLRPEPWELLAEYDDHAVLVASPERA